MIASHDQLAQFRFAVVQRPGARGAAGADQLRLTIIYGTLGVLNLAHGAMFMLGGYAGYVAYTLYRLVRRCGGRRLDFVMVLGVLMERVIIRHFYTARMRTSFSSPSA